MRRTAGNCRRTASKPRNLLIVNSHLLSPTWRGRFSRPFPHPILTGIPPPPCSSAIIGHQMKLLVSVIMRGASRHEGSLSSLRTLFAPLRVTCPTGRQIFFITSAAMQVASSSSSTVASITPGFNRSNNIQYRSSLHASNRQAPSPLNSYNAAISLLNSRLDTPILRTTSPSPCGRVVRGEVCCANATEL